VVLSYKIGYQEEMIQRGEIISCHRYY
jgi:hypothetical protein